VAGSTKKKKTSPRRKKKKASRKRGRKTKFTVRSVTEDKVQIQFRVGQRLVNKMDAVAQAHVDEETGRNVPQSRNEWLINAVMRKLRGKAPIAEFSRRVQLDSTKERIPILFRVGSKIRDAIDQAVERESVPSRTAWMIEAILAGIEGWTFDGID